MPPRIESQPTTNPIAFVSLQVSPPVSLFSLCLCVKNFQPEEVGERESSRARKPGDDKNRQMALRQLASLRGASQKEGRDGHVFVHLSHPDDMRDRSLQTSIRRHVMRDIGRARRKRQRAVVVPLEVELAVPAPEAEADDGPDAPVVDTLRLRRDRVYWSLDQSGLLGLELDSRALQLVGYSESRPPAAQAGGRTARTRGYRGES